MAELLLKTNEEPTFWNKEAAIGFFLGNFLGGLIGGLIGKERMKKEKILGKPVSDNPSFWNKDTLLGGLIGSALGGIATAAIWLFALQATAIPVAASFIPLAGMLVGGYVGGKSGQEDERKEYFHAKAQQQAHEISSSPVMEHSQSPSRNFTQHIEQERALAAAQHQTR